LGRGSTIQNSEFRCGGEDFSTTVEMTEEVAGQDDTFMGSCLGMGKPV